MKCPRCKAEKAQNKDSLMHAGSQHYLARLRRRSRCDKALRNAVKIFLFAYETRAIKGTGVTYAPTPQGADHTCELTIRAKVDHLDPKGQVELSRGIQYNMAGYDTLGVCLFSGIG